MRGAWVAGRRENDSTLADAATMTHTICDDCVTRLRQTGYSR